MKTPERSVEECVEEIVSQIVIDDLQKSSLRWLIKTALTAERQRCEEVEGEKQQFLTILSKIYEAGDDRKEMTMKYWQRINSKLTQPNNTK
jgi:hypothetical protein